MESLCLEGTSWEPGPNPHPHFTGEQTETHRCGSPRLRSPSKLRAKLGLPTPAPSPSPHTALPCLGCRVCVHVRAVCARVGRVPLLLPTLVCRTRICLPVSAWAVCHCSLGLGTHVWVWRGELVLVVV